MISSVSEFLEEITKSPVRIELLNFFYENQFAMDTAKNLSCWINRDLFEVEKELGALVKLKVLEKIGEGSFAVYSYTPDLETNNIIERYIKLSRGEEKYA